MSFGEILCIFTRCGKKLFGGLFLSKILKIVGKKA